MKRRQIEPGQDAERSEQQLCEALLAMRTVDEMRALLDDLCTPAEREAMRDRWCVVPHLLEGEPYRQIHERTAVSITTIGRVARCLEQGAGGYRLAARRVLGRQRRAGQSAGAPA
jgi:TrpR-related protein YerC/YecD